MPAARFPQEWLQGSRAIWSAWLRVWISFFLTIRFSSKKHKGTNVLCSQLVPFLIFTTKLYHIVLFLSIHFYRSYHKSHCKFIARIIKMWYWMSVRYRRLLTILSRHGIITAEKEFMRGRILDFLIASISHRNGLDHIFDHLQLRTTWKQCFYEHTKASNSGTKAPKSLIE